MLFRKQKTEAPITYPYGFLAEEQPSTVFPHKGLICFLKGLIIYAAVSGTIGALISSFALPCHPVTIFVGLFVMAIALAFIHYSRLVFNVCYPVLFIVFTYSIFAFRYQVNSGYQAFLSILQEYYSDYYDLSILREAQEAIADRSLTITYAALFIGFFLLILLNIAVSEYMSLPSVFLLTFPIFQLGIYIDLMPHFIYLVLLLFSYFMVGILRRSEHFLLPYRDKKFTEFKRKTKNEVTQYKYHASGKMMLQLTALLLVFSVGIGILSLPLLLSANASAQVSLPRQKADQIVRNFTQSGLSGLFNFYEAKGGISQGKLGGVSQVRPDYETDLVVTFVPFAYETLYLKAFTGGDYTGRSFKAPDYDQSLLQEKFGVRMSGFEHYTSNIEATRLGNYTETHRNHGIAGRMKVENLDAEERCLYLPYYTEALEDETKVTSRAQSVMTGITPIGSDYTLSYYPLLHNYWPINQNPDELLDYYAENDPGSSQIFADFIYEYDAFCQRNYLSVPEELSDYLTELHEEIGTSVSIPEQIVMIKTYLEKNYKYDMSPGTTPYRQDFVKYFLQTQKRGYCAHFAAAATMLLRSYGIPARYVEGYAISFLEMSEADATGEPVEEWFSGENPIGDAGVISVEVPDADAHAWVEIYKPGIGWVPYEFTPPSDDEDTSSAYSDFWALFSDLISPNLRGAGAAQTAAEDINASARTFSRLGNAFLMPFFLFALGIAAVACLLLLAGRAYRAHKRKAAYRSGDYVPLLSHRYQQAVALCHRKGIIARDVVLPTAFYGLIAEQLSSSAKMPGQAEMERQMDVLEKCCFSRSGITKKEADDLLLFLTRLCALCRSYRSKT